MKSAASTHEAHPFLNTINALCVLFAERAEQVDVGGPANDLFRDNIKLLADSGFFGAAIPQHDGGLGLPERILRECVERISAACGATAFAQNQMHISGKIVAESREEMRRAILPRISSGKNLCGVAFTHLRRPEGSPVIAERVAKGYTLNGSAPWISDWNLLTSFVLGASVEKTGELLFCYVDRKKSAAHLCPSPPLQLSVMSALGTVSVVIQDLFVPDGFVLRRCTPDQLRREDLLNINSQIPLPLGCARGSVRDLVDLNRPLAADVAARLEAEIDSIRSDSEYWNGSRSEDPGYMENALRVRAAATSVALRGAETLIAADFRRAHLVGHPAQRRLREAGFYSTISLTSDAQAALMQSFAEE